MRAQQTPRFPFDFAQDKSRREGFLLPSSEEFKAIEWQEGRVRILDQTQLPQAQVYLELEDYRAVAAAIREMRVRGAPAIGVAGAYGLALGSLNLRGRTREAFLAGIQEIAQELMATRPTAVNLAWAIQRLLRVAQEAGHQEPADGSPEPVLSEAEGLTTRLANLLLAEARRIQQEDEAANRHMGALGADLIPEGATVLTHCNAGALATAGYGTALGVLRAAWEQGKLARVVVDETRPLLQGARLTTWELAQLGIPTTLIADSAAGLLLHRGEVTCVVVGADRIAANGDVANKIGTYSLAVLAKENGVPFYVAAPTSTIDLACPDGEHIPIEERRPEEVTSFGGVTVAPKGTEVRNPAFDVTPARYVTAIITELGIVRPPYAEGLKRSLRQGGVSENTTETRV